MSSENKRSLLIHTPNGPKRIDVDEEQFNRYLECFVSKKKNNAILAFLGGILSAALSYRGQRAMYLKKGLVGIATMAMISAFGSITSSVACGPILQDIINENAVASENHPTEQKEEDISVDDARQPSDFTHSLDFGTPITFSSDITVPDTQELIGTQEEKTPDQKKRVTYDELWRSHNQDSYARHEPSRSRNEEISQSELPQQKTRIRTNKYGDPLE